MLSALFGTPATPDAGAATAAPVVSASSSVVFGKRPKKPKAKKPKAQDRAEHDLRTPFVALPPEEPVADPTVLNPGHYPLGEEPPESPVESVLSDYSVDDACSAQRDTSLTAEFCSDEEECESPVTCESPGAAKVFIRRERPPVTKPEYHGPVITSDDDGDIL